MHKEPFKGVKELISQDKIAEPLEKGITRQNFGLTVFKDGTVRFDATNSPLTQFKPSWIGTSIEKAKRILGYSHDIDGKPIRKFRTDNRTCVCKMLLFHMKVENISFQPANTLMSLLEKFYGKSSFYNVKNIEELNWSS